MQKELYRIASKTDSRKMAEFLSKDDQLLLPLLDIEQRFKPIWLSAAMDTKCQAQRVE
ncbi:MAG TPA: hypothetical protein VMW16_01160 [Sedimentisphaerales bacterium]|nr:hypothetical protein [Sedimentisphaerales bacterium]